LEKVGLELELEKFEIEEAVSKLGFVTLSKVEISSS
jgi:hypothetical protein